MQPVKNERNNNKSHTLGIVYSVAAYVAWGVLPLYWKALKEVPAGEILAHRIVWSCVFVFIVLIGLGALKEIREIIFNRKRVLVTFLGSLLISANWFTYIWAVNHNQVIETSLGYYINPLLTIMLGVVILHERIDRWQVVSLFLGFTAVCLETIQYGKIPWVALTLAITFGLYGLVKKLSNISSLHALALETIMVTPVALGYLVFKQLAGTGTMGHTNLIITVVLILSGVVTAIPLLWFAKGAKLVPLSTVGFIQYLSPSIGLLLGIFVFKEPFTGVRGISFGLIWCALALYTFTRQEFIKHIRVGQQSQKI